jgi:Tol biopolymer transport system component
MSGNGGTERCGRCGAEYATSSSPLGLCPACLLKLGMSGVAMAPSEPDPEPESAAPPVSSVPSFAGRRPRLASRAVWIAIAIVMLVTAAAYFFMRASPRQPLARTHASAIRFTVTLPDEAELLEGSQLAVSPDGLNLVVAARGADRVSRLWVRRLQSLDWRQLAQTDGARLPFWSPDSQHIGFFTGRALKRIDISNGLTQTVCDAALARGGTWSNNENVIVFAASGGVFRVPASGGVPAMLPNAERHTDSRQVVGDQLLFSHGTTLAVQRIDPGRGTPIGEAQTIAGVEDVSGAAEDGAAFSASSTVLVYRRAATRLGQLSWLGRAGEVIGTIGEPGEYESVAVSPSGQRMAVVRRDGRGDASSLWVLDASGQRLNRVTFGTSRDASPIWSPDETRIAYRSARNGRNDLYSIVAEGSQSEKMLFESPQPAFPTDWSRDGRLLLYTVRSSTTGDDVWALPVGGDGKPQVLLQSPSNESQAVASPDGRWMAYVSDESGGDHVYVRPFPPAEGRWQISSEGGMRPRWGPDGRELFFVSGDGRLMSVEIASEPRPALRFSPPRSLFRLRGGHDYVVDRARRFFVLMPLGEPGSRELQVIINWASELREF